MRKILLLLASAIPVLSAAQEVWTQRTSLGGVERFWANAFTIDGKGYITSGMTADSVGLMDHWQYDPGTDTWTERASLPVARFRAVSMSVGDKGFVGTGMSDTLPGTSDWFRYDPILDEWLQRPNLPGPNRVDAFGFVLDDICYVGGGLSTNGTGLDDLYRYDPNLNQWSELNVLPDGPISAAATFVVGNKAYVVGGRSEVAGQFSNELRQFDPATNTWYLKAPFPGEARINAVAFSVGPYGFVGTGNTGMHTADWYAYDTMVDQWYEIQEQFSGEPRSMAVGFAIGSFGYVATGAVGINGAVNDLYEFDSSMITSIGNEYGKPSVSVQPNPSNGLITVHYGNLAAGAIQLMLYDVIGQEVWSGRMNSGTAQTIDLSALPSGTYYLRSIDSGMVAGPLVIE